MNKPVTLIITLSLILTLTVCITLLRHPETVYAQDGNVLPDQNDVEQVLIALTKLDVNDLILDVNDQPLDVNDQTLELRYKIKNGSDQDIWVCKGTGWIAYDANALDYESYFKEDEQTLIIRRRLNVPTMIVHYILPEALYVRLQAGEQRVESFSLPLPVRPRRLFSDKPLKRGILHARRLVFEIGYHTKDLAKIMLDSMGSVEDTNMFDEVLMSYLSFDKEGEYLLQITVDGVLIPYEEVPAAFVDNKSKAETELVSRRVKQLNSKSKVKMMLTGAKLYKHP